MNDNGLLKPPLPRFNRGRLISTLFDLLLQPVAVRQLLIIDRLIVMMIISDDLRILINASSDDGDDLHSKNNEVKIYRQLYQTMYIVLTIEKISIIKKIMFNN